MLASGPISGGLGKCQAPHPDATKRASSSSSFWVLPIFTSRTGTKSVEAYSKALKFGAKPAGNPCQSRHCAMFRGRILAGALEDFRAVLKADQRSAMANTYVGICLYELGRIEEACIILTRPLRLEPRSPEAIYNKARALFQLQRAAEDALPLLSRHWISSRASWNVTTISAIVISSSTGQLTRSRVMTPP